MKVDKLFQVLVVGGGLLMSGATMVPAHASEEDAPQPVFCDPAGDMCETLCDGTKQVKSGFECCWSTSCEE